MNIELLEKKKQIAIRAKLNYIKRKNDNIKLKKIIIYQLKKLKRDIILLKSLKSSAFQ